ncbi:hypothetical protein [Streptomyces sp. CA-111067]|uniref:hypothetical protein n=1 Tax=Streptomyces sp. CA-111067 TaxID=3240046 RepID=UPI003D9650A9
MDTHRSNSPDPAADQPRTAASTATTVAVAEAEAALVEHYPRLVRLAYLTLPAAMSRHRRVLVAHRLVQRALPKSRTSTKANGGAYGLLRQEVLRAALAYGQAGRVKTALAGLGLPQIMGLRLHPRAGGSEELALDRALAKLPPEARAAFALCGAEELSPRAARGVLETAGAADARGALRAAAAVEGDQRLLAEGEFDPSTLQTRPTDLLRRRHRGRTGLIAAGTVALAALLVPLATDDGSSPPSYAASGPPGSGDAKAQTQALDPAALLSPKADEWASTARMDFTAWPARGDAVSDSALLRRALAVWANPGSAVQVDATPGTPRTGPSQPPQLLFAGQVDNARVVVFYDGQRLVRYAEPRSGHAAAALDFARADDSDITTAAAVVLDRVNGSTRFLTAPWIADAQTRDLLRPDRLGTELHRTAAGVTDPVRMPGTGAAAGTCGTSWPVLQLRSSARIVEQHTFLLTDLGDLTPVHLTYTPPPGPGAPARQPREATGSPALVSWAHSACRLGELRGQGVKAVNDWEFARSALPDGGGEASWTCDRADTWRGPGHVTVQFVPPDAGPTALGTVAGEQTDGNACSRFGQHVMAGVMWKSPTGNWYLVAAGSRDVSAIDATAGVRASSHGPFLAVRAARGTRATLSGKLSTGGTIAPLGQ